MAGPRQRPRNNKLIMLGVALAMAAAIFVVIF